MTSSNVVRHDQLDDLIPITKYLSAPVANAEAVANTLASISELAFAVMAGRVYEFEFVFFYTAAATATGSRWTLDGPAATSLGYKSEYTLTATTNTINNAVAYNIPAASNATSLAGVNIAVIKGYVVPSANGEIIPRFASEVTVSAITALKGSKVIYREVA